MLNRHEIRTLAQMTKIVNDRQEQESTLTKLPVGYDSWLPIGAFSVLVKSS